MKITAMLWMGWLIWAAVQPARADGNEARVPLAPLYVQECGSCHVPYAPRLLGAESWQRLMAGLPRHFGNDASVDAAVQRELTRWLSANAAGSKRARNAPPEDRITRSAWFLHEHDELDPAGLSRAGIKSAADCGACHSRAVQGSYAESEIRMPKGTRR